MKKLWSKGEVEKILPQKLPFVMISGLVSENSILFAELFISAENILVEENLFSEAGITEFMAQSIAVVSAFSKNESDTKSPIIGFIGAIKSLQILRQPKLGESIYGKVEKIYEAIGIQLSKVEVLDSSKKIIAQAEIKTVLSP